MCNNYPFNCGTKLELVLVGREFISSRNSAIECLKRCVLHSASCLLPHVRPFASQHSVQQCRREHRPELTLETALSRMLCPI